MPDRQRGEIIRSRGPVALPVQGRRCCYRLRHAAAPEGPLGAVEHLETLCCLGRKPESAMIAVVQVLHEIIPGGSSRIWFCESDATMGGTNGENPQGTTKRAGSGTYFELHFAMLRVLAAKDPRLCVHFLYGGESPGFFEFSAQNRGLVAAMAIKAA